MRSLLCAFITVYLVVMFARAVLSWIPPQGGGGGLATLNRILLDLTEPVLAPLRRLIPPVGMFDLSFLVAVVALFILRGIVCA